MFNDLLGTELEKNMSIFEGLANCEWQRGYYCAVAVLLREEGQATTAVRSLYVQCGGTKFADAEDIALFAQHGLVPNETKLTGERNERSE